MTQYQVWTKEPGEEDFEKEKPEFNSIGQAQEYLIATFPGLPIIVQITKTESENPNEYIKVDV